MRHFMRMTPEGDPEEGAPAPEKVLAGDPRFRTWNLEERDGLYAGIWESTPGKWTISYDEWEYCRILSGRSVITVRAVRTAAPKALRRTTMAIPPMVC